MRLFRCWGQDVVAVAASTLAVQLVGEILNRKMEGMGHNPATVHGQAEPLWQPGLFTTSRRRTQFRSMMGALSLKASSAFPKQRAETDGIGGESGSLDWNGCIPGSWIPSFWAGRVSLKRAQAQSAGGR